MKAPIASGGDGLRAGRPFLFVVWLLVGAFADIELQAEGRPADLAPKIDPLFQQIVESNWPGAAVLVARDGAIIFQKGYGLAQVESGAPMTTETRSRIGSITKEFTAAAILKLAEG